MDDINLEAPAAPSLSGGAQSALGLGADPLVRSSVKRLGDLSAERSKAQSAYDTQSAGLQTKIQAEREAAGALQPPKLDNVPDKFEHKGMTPEELSDATKTMFLLASLGGLMTRAPMTTALKAFSAGVNGLVAGDTLAFNRNKDEFDRNFKVAIAKNAEARQEYQDAFKKHRGNMQDLMNEWTIIAKKHGDTVSAVNMERQDIQAQLRHIETMGRMDLQAKGVQERLGAETRRITEMERANRERERLQQEGIDARFAAATLANDAGGGKPLTEGERKAGLFYRQMRSAQKEAEAIVKEGFGTADLMSQIDTRMAGSDWTNWAASDEAQRYRQTTEQWAEAYLRLKTGAATNANEISRNARTFWPQPGDKPDVIAQKERMRLQAETDVKFAAGRGAGAAPAEGPQNYPTAVNAKGEKVIFKDGKWQPETK